MAKRRGRPADYVDDREGKPIVGLSQHKTSGRYYATFSSPRVYFGRDYDLAVARFRSWETRNRTIALPSPRPIIPNKEVREAPIAEGWITRRAAEGIVPWPARIDEKAVWEWLREQICNDPHRAAQRLGVPEIAYLTELRKPEPSLTLDEIRDAYVNGKKNLTDHWARKTRLFWSEFTTVVDKQTLRQIDGDDIARYHDWVWEHVEKHSRSPTWVNQRLGAVRTVLRYALKRGRDLTNVRRVLDLTEIFETKRKSGVDPRPIEPRHFAKRNSSAICNGGSLILLK